MSATIRPISLPTSAMRGSGAAAVGVRWEISACALLSSPGAAVLNGEAARLERCALVWRIEGESARAELELRLVGGETHTIELAAGVRVVRVASGGVESIDAPGLLAMTFRTGSGEVLFARTTLLGERLGLPGGVYDAPVSCEYEPRTQ